MSFEDEYRVLLRQFLDRINELESKEYELFKKGKLSGKDGGYSKEIRKENILYREKVKELKKKYNVD